LDPSRLAASGDQWRCWTGVVAAALAGLLLVGEARAQEAAGAAPTPDAVTPHSLEVSRFVIEDAYPDLAAAAQRLFAPLRNRPVTEDQIRAAAAQLQQAYIDGGHLLTRVDLPSLDIPPGGELRIQVVHGFIERIDADGVPVPVRPLVLRYVSPLVGRRAVTSAMYQRAVLLANRLPSLRLHAKFRPGTVEAGTILVLTGGYRAFSTALGVDNYMPTVLGHTSASLMTAYNPAARSVEQVFLNASAAADVDPLLSDAPYRYVETGFRSALGTSGVELELRYLWAMSNPPLGADAGDTGNAFIDNSAAFRRVAFRLSYPVVKNLATNVSVAVGYDATAEFQIENPFANSLYADHLRVLRMAVSASHAFGTGTDTALDVELSQGLDAFGSRGPSQATATVPLSQPGASDVFTKVEIHGTLRQALGAGVTLDLRAHGQYVGGRPLLLAEKFTLGGPSDLSGYDFAYFSGDRGYALRAEVQHLLDLPRGAASSLLQSYVFAAHGEVVNLQPIAPERGTDMGSAAGFGFRASVGRDDAAFGPVDLSAELARQFNPASAYLTDRWRVNLAATLHF
jgi:hemolysin activation/secretion protein